MTRPSHPHQVRQVLLVATVIALVAVTGVGVALAWSTSGWHLTVQSTPSMLSVIPIGALVVLAPTSWASLHKGEIVGVRPTPGAVPVVHYVASVTPTTLRTHNLLSRVDDAWVLHPHRGELVGRAVLIVPGLGWALSWWPIPVVLVAGLLLGLRLEGWRRVVGFGAGIYVAGLLWLARFHPLSGIRDVGETTSGHVATLVAVSRGLAPQRIVLDGTPHRIVRVAPGGLLRAAVRVRHLPAVVPWSATPVLSWGWEVALWGGIALPAVVGLVAIVVAIARSPRQVDSEGTTVVLRAIGDQR